MIMYLLALVVIACSIFGLTYSQTSIQAIRDVGERSSTIQLPTFMHRTPLIQRPQAGVEGDKGNATRSSQQSFEISSQGMEEVSSGQGQSEDDRYQFERRIFEQKLRDANQIGLAASPWPEYMQNEEKMAFKPCSSDATRAVPQKINTNTIFNMIQYETFKEAMAVLKHQQELDEAERAAALDEQHETSTTTGEYDNIAFTFYANSS